jgi:hypothetical protein
MLSVRKRSAAHDLPQKEANGITELKVIGL